MPEAVKQTRVLDAYERLKNEILTNNMPPGFQAPEPEIAMRLGMSRTPVREALIRLQAEGLIELIPRRGVRILPVRPEDMAEIYEILTVLEPKAAANLAATRPGTSTLAPLEDATSRMERALAANDLDAWAEADDRFHRQLLAMQDNRRLLAFVSALYDQAHRARMVTLSMRGPPVQSTKEHRRILHHLKKGDVDATRIAFRKHRERAGREMLDVLKKHRLQHL